MALAGRARALRWGVTLHRGFISAILLLLLLLAAAVGTSAAAHRPSMPVCEDANEWPPYTHYRRTSGQRSEQVTGFSVELLRLIAQRRGFSVQVHMLPWKRCVEAVRSGEMLGFLNAIRTPDRDRDFWVSPEIYETRLILLGLRSRFPQGLDLPGQDALKPLRVGGLHGYSYSQLDAIAPETLVRAPNYPSMLKMLRNDRVDVVLINEGVLQGLLTLEQLPPDWDHGLVHGTLADRQPSRFHMMFSRKHPDGERLHAWVSAELPLLERSGELAKLREQWLRGLR